jgi:hypothetical protein
MIFLNGHGSEDCVCGPDDEKLVQAGDNETILAGAVVNALSCRAARVRISVTVTLSFCS